MVIRSTPVRNGPLARNSIVFSLGLKYATTVILEISQIATVQKVTNFSEISTWHKTKIFSTDTILYGHGFYTIHTVILEKFSLRWCNVCCVKQLCGVDAYSEQCAFSQYKSKQRIFIFKLLFQEHWSKICRFYIIQAVHRTIRYVLGQCFPVWISMHLIRTRNKVD